MDRNRRALRAPLAGGLALLVAACAGYGPGGVKVGQTAAEVAQSMGQPTGRYSRPDGGQRLEYARGPYGKHTYMIDLDSAGRVTHATQVLEEFIFERVKPGATRDQVLYEIGRPSEVYAIGWQNIDVWAYRYPTDFSLCQWFQVGMGRDGKVTGTSYGIDPRCDVGRNDSSSRS